MEESLLMNDTTKMAFEVILLAGDARTECENALVALENDEDDKIDGFMEKAEKKITEAHKIHTEALQNEISNPGSSEYSMLFAHSQDTLMTINSEILIAKHLIKIYRKINQKLK